MANNNIKYPGMYFKAPIYFFGIPGSLFFNIQEIEDSNNFVGTFTFPYLSISFDNIFIYNIETENQFNLISLNIGENVVKSE